MEPYYRHASNYVEANLNGTYMRLRLPRSSAYSEFVYVFRTQFVIIGKPGSWIVDSGYLGLRTHIKRENTLIV